MGKALVIKGADFSINGIEPEFVKLNSIVATAGSQCIKSPINFPKEGKIVFEATPTDDLGLISFGFDEQRKGVAAYPNDNKSVYNPNYGFLWYVGGGYSSITLLKNEKNTYVVTNYEFYENGVKKGARLPQRPEITINDVPFGIFGTITDGYGIPWVFVGYKLHSFKMYANSEDNNSLILDAIPVKRVEDGKICLYDRVSGTYLFTMDGTNPDYESL